MTLTKPFIFISCGQFLLDEKRLGLDIKKAIEELTAFDGYFAEAQSSANGLVANILERLHNCAGFVVVMHPRGEVRDEKGNLTVRGSVWIEQEIAVISFVQHFVRKETEIKIAAYIHQSIKREGIRDLIHLNPVLFDNNDAILADLRSRLPDWKLSQTAAIKDLRWQRYQEEMHRLSREHIEGLRILTIEGPTNDQNALPRLNKKGLAQNFGGLFEGMCNTTIFAQPVPGQPPAHQQLGGQRIFEIKPEAKDFLEHYFTANPD